MGACFLGLVVLVVWGGVACVEFFYFLFTVSCEWSSFVRFLLSHIFLRVSLGVVSHPKIF